MTEMKTECATEEYIIIRDKRRNEGAQSAGFSSVKRPSPNQYIACSFVARAHCRLSVAYVPGKDERGLSAIVYEPLAGGKGGSE